MKKKKKLSEDELKDIFEKVYVDKTDYDNINSKSNIEHLSDDYQIIGGIIYTKKQKED